VILCSSLFCVLINESAGVCVYVCVCVYVYLSAIRFLIVQVSKKILSSHFSPHNFPISRNVNKIASSICSPFYICLFKTFSLSLQIREPQLSYNTNLPSGMCDCKYNANCIPSFFRRAWNMRAEKIALVDFSSEAIPQSRAS